MRKLNLELEAVVVLPIRVKISLLVWLAEHDDLRRIVKYFAQGKFRTTLNEIEDVQIIEAQFDDGLDGEDSLAEHVEKALEEGNSMTIISSNVTDSR